MNLLKFFLFFFVLFVAVFADSPLCRILKGVAQPPPVRADGLSGWMFWQDIAEWIGGDNCDSIGNTFDYDSGPVPPGGTTYSDISKVSLSANSLYRFVHATYDPSSQLASVSVGVSTETLALYNSLFPVKINISMGFNIFGLPLALAGRYDPVWHGSIITVDDQSSVIIFDHDLFDGHAPIVFESRSGTANSEALSNTDKILSLAADANLRLVHFDAVPTVIGNDISARLAFMRPSTLPASSASQSYGRPENVFSIVWNSAECVGSNCDSDIVNTLAEFAAADSVCTNPTVITNSVHGRLYTTMLINSTAAVLNAAHAMSKAIFRCSSDGKDGYLSIVLEAISSNETSVHYMDVKTFLSDKRSAVLMMKNGGFKLRGHRVGYVKDGDVFYTPSKDDLFGPGYGGVFVKDYPLTDDGKEQFTSLYNAFFPVLSGDDRLVEVSVNIIFDGSDPGKIYDSYLSRSTVQTQYGLLSYFVSLFDGLTVVKSDTKDATVSIAANIHSHLASHLLEYAPGVKGKVSTYFDAMVKDIISRCGCGVSNIPTMETTKFATGSSYLVIVGSVDVTLKQTGLNGDCLSQLPNFYRSASFYAPLTIEKNDVLLGADLNYTTEPLSIVFSNVKTNNLQNIPNQLVYYTQSVGTIFDDAISGSTLKQLQLDFLSMADAINNLEDRMEDALKYIAEGRSLSYPIRLGALAIPSIDGSIIQSFIVPFRTAFSSIFYGRQDEPFGAFDVSFSNNQGIAKFHFANTQKIAPSVSGAHWCRMIDVTRAQITVPLTYNVNFNTGSKDLSFSISGSSSKVVILPVRDGMRVGHITSASVYASVDYPSYAYYSLTLGGNIERGSSVTGKFRAELIATDDSSTEFPYSFEIEEANNGYYNNGAEPEEVMSAFVGLLKTPQEIAVHRLAAPLAPLAKALSEIVNLGDEWEEKAQWVYSIAPYAVLAQSVPFGNPTTQDYSQRVTIHVNGKTFGPCAISVSKGSLVDSTLLSVRYGLEYCTGILDYVSPEINTFSSDGSFGGTVVLHPRYPGAIYNFTVETESNPSNLFSLQNWHESERIPDFLSWNDMYKLVYAAFLRSEGYKFTLPVITTVSTEKLVPASRRAFYPSTFNAVYFPAKTSITRHAKNVPLQTEFHSSEDASVDGNGVSIKIPEGSVVPDVEVTADVEMMFGVSFWCALGDGTLTMGTGFDDSCIDRTLGFAKVPQSPNNTFVFSTVIEKRSSSNPNAIPELIKLSKQITLVPGKLVGESLIKDMPGQLDSLVAKMINITLDGDGFCADMASILMTMSTLQEDTTLYVPLRIQITDSRITAVGTGSESPATIEAITSCPITKDMIVGIDVQLHDYEEEDKKVLKNIPCTGSVGILGLSDCKANIQGRHILSASNRMQDSMAHEMRGAVVNGKVFDEFYENHIDFDTTVTLHDLAFDVSHNALKSELRKEKIVLSKVGTTPVVSSKDYSLSAFSAQATTPVLNGLIHTSQEDFCRGVEVSQSVAHSFVSKDEMKQNVPFTEQSLAPVYTTLVEDPLRSVHRALCEKRLLRETVTTTSEFCKAIKRHWGFVYHVAPTSVPDICGSITLNEEGLVLPLSLKFADRHASAPFFFDANRVGNRDIVFSGYGSNGTVDLALDAEATFGIKFGFGETTNMNKRGPVTLDKTASRMMISARAIPNKYIRAAAGSIVVDIDASYIDVLTKVVSEFSEDIKHTSDMSRDIYDWQVEDKSLLLRDGSYERVSAVLSGQAYLGAIVSNNKTIGQWSMKVSAPRVNDFYSPAPSVGVRGTMYDTVQFSSSCIRGKKNDGGLLNSIAAAADFSTLAKYFESDVTLFTSQWFKNITKDLIDILVDDVTNQAIGFLGKHIQEITHTVFDSIVGDQVAGDISTDIKNIVDKIIKNSTYPNVWDLEREVLKVFTGFLNEEFKEYLVEPIKTPDVDPKNPKYSWNMRFGKTTQIAATDVDWSLGDHGYADLELSSHITVSMAWTASFDVVWTKEKGITIEWPVSPAFSSTITAAGSSLEVSGSFLFVAADFVGNFNAYGKLSGNPFKKDISFKLDSTLQGNGKLGLVGLLRQKTAEEKRNAMQTLPYVNSGIDASWSFTWGTGQKRPSTPASWKFVKPQLCLGSLFTEFLRTATHEIDRVVKPLEPVFGSDGVLLKPIPGLSTLFGKKCNVLSVLEVVCELFSSKSCNVRAVHNIIHVFNTIADDIAKLRQFEQWLQDPYGCNDLMLNFSNFVVNWTRDKPTPEKTSAYGLPYNKKGSLVFGSGINDYRKRELTKFLNRKASVNDVPSNEKGALIFGPGISPDQQQALIEYYGKWNGGVPPCIEPDLSSNSDDDDDNKFGIQLDILQDFPSKFLRIILGDNVELLSVHFPEVSFSFGYDWSIPIYPFPYIAVVVGFTASVSLQPPTMILTSKSLTDTIATGNPSYLFRDIGIATNMSFVRGTIEVAGGIEGGISVVIFKAVVSFEVYLQFNAAAKVTSITGQDFETIDSLSIQMRQYGLVGVIDFDLNLKAGVRLSIKACINLFFFSKCWTLVSWQTDVTLWDYRPAKDKIPDIAPYNGQIDGKHVDFIYNFDNDPLGASSIFNNVTVRDGVDKPTYYIGVKSVMLLPKGGREANAALTKGVEGVQTVQWQSGTECSSSGYKVIVAGDSPRQNTILPSCQTAEVEIFQNGYHEATKFQISRTSVVPDTRPGVTLGAQSSGVYLSNPEFGVSYEFVGAPAYPFKLDGSTASKASFIGSSSNYAGSTVEITSKIDRITFDVSCSSFRYQSTQITCDGLTVTYPEGTQVYRYDHKY